MTSLQLSDKVNYITPEMFQKILDYVDSKKFDSMLQKEDVKMIFEIAYHCALRVNEVLKLTQDSFDFELNEINLGKTKTEQRGLATIPQSFKCKLKDYVTIAQLSESLDNRLFPISRQTAYNWLMKIGKDLDIKALTTPQSNTNEKTKTHIFRKSKAKDMLYAKAPLNIIQRKLRHSNINTTSGYLKLKLDDVKDWENNNS